MDGNAERLAATFLSDASDPTRLSWKEVKESWGSWTNFMLSYGLKPWNHDDLEEALAISRALKQADD
jgi:hypothetical protein